MSMKLGSLNKNIYHLTRDDAHIWGENKNNSATVLLFLQMMLDLFIVSIQLLTSSCWCLLVEYQIVFDFIRLHFIIIIIIKTRQQRLAA